MKKIVAFLFVIFIGVGAKAQFVEWALGQHSSRGYSMVLDHSGNVCVVGGKQAFNSFNSNGYIKKLSPNGNLLWEKTFEGSDNGVYGIGIDSFGNIYVAGQMQGTVDLDPGSGTFSVFSQGSNDLYIVKLDPAGEFVWGQTYGGSGNESIISMAVDDLGGVYISGWFEDTVDFGSGSQILTTTDFRNNFFQKLDALGNLVWVEKFGNTNSDVIWDLYVNQTGLYLTGSFKDTIDFDFGVGTYIMDALFYNDIFVQKITTSGNFAWAKKIGAEMDFLSGRGVVADDSGYVYSCGYGFQETDMDPGTGTYILDLEGGYVQKMNPAGEFVWVQGFSSSTMTAPASMGLDSENNLYMTGSLYQQTDLDPGPGQVLVNPLGTAIYILKLDPNGYYVWSYAVGADIGSGLAVDIAGHVYGTGHFSNETDFDPGPDSLLLPDGNGSQPSAYILKLHQDSCALLVLTVDSVSDIFCANSGYMSTTVTGGQPPYTYLWNTNPPSSDSLIQFLEYGVYTFTVISANGCTLERSFLINSPDTIYGTEYDMDVYAVAAPFRPGVFASVQLDVFNRGCMNNQPAQLKVRINSLADFFESIPIPDQISGDTVIWNLASHTYDSAHFVPQIIYSVSGTASIGDSIYLETWINPLGNDIKPSNNHKLFRYPIVNSYDPNDKQVYPYGVCEEKYVRKDEKLTYTVRFQNTGNADAINIFILDSLDSALDMTSIRVLSKSHEPMLTEVLSGHVLKFRFDDIHLADATNNEPESHGYVIFEVSPLPSLSNGTPIKNTAHIYFDHNEPIITNTITHTLVDVLPVCNLSLVPQNQIVAEFSVYPNPAQEYIQVKFSVPQYEGSVELLDALGRIVERYTVNGNSLQIDLTGKANGIYWLRALTAQSLSGAKFMKQ